VPRTSDDSTTGIYIMLFIILAALATVFSLVLQCLTASGEVEFCYVSATVDDKYALIGHRSYRPDVMIGRFETFEASLSAAASMKCSINAPQRTK